MLRIAIAEDEPAFARKLEEHLRKFAQEEQIEIHVDTFPNGATLVERYTAEWDLLLLTASTPPGASAGGMPTCSSCLLPTWPNMPSKAMKWMRWTMCSSR